MADRRRWWYVLLGLVVSLALGFWVLQQIQGTLVVAAFRETRPLPLAGAVLCFTLALMTRARAWQVLLGQKVRFAPVFWSLMVGFLFTTLLPFRLGEVVRVAALHQTARVPWALGFSSVAVARLTDAGLLALMVAATAPRVWRGPALLQKVEFWLVVALVGVLGVWLAVKTRHRLSAWLEARLPAEWVASRPWQAMKGILDTLAPLEDPGVWARLLFWKGLTWGLLVLEHWLLLRLWFPQATLTWSAWLVGVASLGVALPSAPGHVGVVEASIVAALRPFGVDPNRALALALVKHAIYLGVTTLLGLFGVGYTGVQPLRKAKDQTT